MVTRALRTRLCETFARGARVGLDRIGRGDGDWGLHRGATETCSRKTCISPLRAPRTSHRYTVEFLGGVTEQAARALLPLLIMALKRRVCAQSATRLSTLQLQPIFLFKIHAYNTVLREYHLYRSIEAIYSSPPVALSLHSVRDLLEARDVRPDNQAGEHFARIAVFQAELGASLKSRPEYALHDTIEPAVDLLEGPGEAGGVLCHFETRDGDAAAVARLAGSVPDGPFNALGASSLEDINRLLGTALGLEGQSRSMDCPKGCANVPC